MTSTESNGDDEALPVYKAGVALVETTTSKAWQAALKRLTWQAANQSLPAAYRLEKKLFVDLWPSADHLEAMAAFKDKRRPDYGG